MYSARRWKTTCETATTYAVHGHLCQKLFFSGLPGGLGSLGSRFPTPQVYHFVDPGRGIRIDGLIHVILPHTLGGQYLTHALPMMSEGRTGPKARLSRLSCR